MSVTNTMLAERRVQELVAVMEVIESPTGSPGLVMAMVDPALVYRLQAHRVEGFGQCTMLFLKTDPISAMVVRGGFGDWYQKAKRRDDE